MPFLDKMKEQASQVAAKAQEAGKAGQAKLEGAQSKRELDGLLRRLGTAVHAHHTGRSEGAEDVGELHAAISAHEAEHGIDATRPSDDGEPPAAPAAAEGSAPAAPPASDAPAGDFTL